MCQLCVSDDGEILMCKLCVSGDVRDPNVSVMCE